MPKIPNTTARDNKPHSDRVGIFVIGPIVGGGSEDTPEYPFSGKARQKKPTIRKVVTNNANLFLNIIFRPPF
jgi:hypothetical protein